MAAHDYADEGEFRQYVRRQLDFFQAIEFKATTADGWLALKLDCSGGVAREIIRWATK